MKALIVGSDYLANRFAYLLKKLSIPSERTSRFTKSSLKGKDAVFFSGKNCLSKSIFDSLRSGCSVFSEQIVFEKRQDISLVNYAERNRLRLVIGSFDVFNPVVREMKSALDKERVFEAFFNRVGPKQFAYVKLNIVDDLVIQDIGIINHLFGDVTVVDAFSRDSYNHCIVRMRSGDTNIFAYANKDAYYKERRIDIFGEKTKLQANLLNQKLTLINSVGMAQSLYGAGYESYKEHLVKRTEPLKDALEQFLNGKRNPVEYPVIQKNLEIAWDIKKAIEAPVHGALRIQSGRLGTK